MASYIGVIHKDQGSDFGVSFPDFPGCITAVKTLDEAGHMAEETLALHVAGMAEDGEKVPAPMLLELVQENELAVGAVVFIVVCVQAPELDKIVRINLTLRESVLRQIDERVARSRISQSSYLVQRALG